MPQTPSRSPAQRDLLKIAIPGHSQTVYKQHIHYHTHYNSSPTREPSLLRDVSSLVCLPVNLLRRLLTRRNLLTPWVIMLALFLSSMVLTFGRYSSELAMWKPWLAKPQTTYSQPPAALLPTLKLDHLIIVCGHAVYSGSAKDSFWGDAETHVSNPHLWVLDPFQAKHAQSNVKFIVKSIQAGMSVATNDAASLLVFSGGKTRLEAGMVSEASGMFQVAETLGWAESSVKERTVTEEFALDSLDNLIFSICRFRQLVKAYPKRITIISMESKRVRFLLLHAKAAQFPTSQIQFVGIPNPSADAYDEEPVEPVIQALVEKLQLDSNMEQELATLPSHEILKSFLPFSTDLYACNGSLRQKKLDRNPFAEAPGYHAESCPEMRSLLNQCSNPSVP